MNHYYMRIRALLLGYAFVLSLCIHLYTSAYTLLPVFLVCVVYMHFLYI